jgi:thiol-disulfide isomerase/thioredoxin
VRTTMLSLLALVPFVGCSDPALEQRVAELERKVDAMNAGGGAPTAAAAKGPTPPTDDPATKAKEQAAMSLLTEANQALSAGDPDTARTKLAQLQKDYGDTRTAARAGKLQSELNIVGKEAPPLDVEKWYTADKTNWNDGKATLVVFFESWCPHCQEEVPKVVATNNKYKGKGLQIVALTRVTKSASDDTVKAFITQHELNFPVAKEKGDLAEAFGVSGIPAAAVVKNGKIVWRGHPGRLTDAMIEGFLAS